MRHLGIRHIVGVLAIPLLALVLAAKAPAAVTIGSALGPSESTLSCSTPGDCTVVQTALPGRQVTSPTDGVVVRWRVKNTSSPIPGRFRIVRPAGGTSFIGMGSARAASGNCPDVCVNQARLPICAGDYIGIDGPTGASGGSRNTIGAALAVWNPFLRDGQARRRGYELASEILLNADVEPDADRDGFGDETQDSDPTAPAATRPPCQLGPPSLSLRLGYRQGHDTEGRRCARGRGISARVTGPDSDKVRSVAFRFGHRDPLLDSRSPFRREIDRARHVGGSHHHHVTASVLMKDGRHAKLRGRLRFCGED